jgi:hypothetical protein
MELVSFVPNSPIWARSGLSNSEHSLAGFGADAFENAYGWKVGIDGAILAAE